MGFLMKVEMLWVDYDGVDFLQGSSFHFEWKYNSASFSVGKILHAVIVSPKTILPTDELNLI